MLHVILTKGSSGSRFGRRRLRFANALIPDDLSPFQPALQHYSFSRRLILEEEDVSEICQCSASGLCDFDLCPAFIDWRRCDT